MGEHWSDFFVAEVGAAAALSGLVIVAISINLQSILTNPHVLPGRAAEALTTLVGAMLVASVGLIPGQSDKLLGAEILVFGLAVMLVSAVAQTRSLVRHKNQPIDWWLPRLVISLLTAPAIVIGGLLLILGAADGLYWVAAGLLMSLAAGVINTWILLIEILR
jgi:hypothetical protein